MIKTHDLRSMLEWVPQGTYVVHTGGNNTVCGIGRMSNDLLVETVCEIYGNVDDRILFNLASLWAIMPDLVREVIELREKYVEVKDKGGATT